MVKALAQKMERCYRAQVAALPIRQTSDGLQVLLISSRETRRWIIPKGWPMKGRKDHQAAAQEAFEEAGVSGKMHKHPIGAYTYQKRLETGVQPCRVMVYVLDVEEVQTSWPEREQRRREWLSANAAADRISEPGLSRLIRSLDTKQDAA
jgi:8-oxo-dGTP pyrophosphatase MutT (NUDIX family)